MDFKLIFGFLEKLRSNNDREWMKENNELYQTAKYEFENFIDIMINVLKEIDSDIDVDTPKECIFRLNRDVRFSKNKSPYKTNFGGLIAPGGKKSPYAGYYIHLEPGSSFVGGGIYMPPPEILKPIREYIFKNIGEFKEIIEDKNFKKYFNEIFGERLKTAPKGFPKDFEDIELLKHKHYAVVHNVKDSFWNSKELINKLSDIFSIQFEFMRFLNNAVKKKK